jgi:CRISPR-associated protein (TIGR03986 family)
MAKEHTNPTGPRVKRNRHTDQVTKTYAHAPYNFVPLPKPCMFTAPPPSMDLYHAKLKSGYIDLEITTLSPTYIRGMVDIENFKRLQGLDISENVHEKEKLADFFSTSTEKVDGKPLPSIPGSSLRGMLRNLVEIITFSPIHAVADDPHIWFREVGQKGAMKHVYNKILGEGGSFIRAGRLKKKGRDWEVLEYPTPYQIDEKRYTAEKNYFEVHDNIIEIASHNGMLGDFIPMYSKGYKLRNEPLKIQFKAEKQEVDGIDKNIVTAIASYPSDNEDLKDVGFLITTGNMLNKPFNKITPRDKKRKYYPVVRAPINENGLRRFQITEEAARVYTYNLSDKVKEDLGSNGCLREDNIIFFIPPKTDGGEIVYFGHNPNMRVPLVKKREYVTPYDMIPENEIPEGTVDYVTAIFGQDLGNDEGLTAGRVSFSDAEIDLNHSAKKIWCGSTPKAITPRILGTPKATAYAHYLMQSAENGHNPDNRDKIAHYGTSISETEIRGHKKYWTQGDAPEFMEEKIEDKDYKENQHTRVIALDKDVVFHARVHFSNLRTLELGALLWALELPFKEGGSHCHRIGMGKPYGMGAIQIKPTLFINFTTDRYASLFKINEEEHKWDVAVGKVEIEPFIKLYDKKVLSPLLQDGANDDPKAGRKRMNMLELLMRWQPKVDGFWREETSYMQLEDFREEAVLPDPEGVFNRVETRRRQGRP